MHSQSNLKGFQQILDILGILVKKAHPGGYKQSNRGKQNLNRWLREQTLKKTHQYDSKPISTVLPFENVPLLLTDVWNFKR